MAKASTKTKDREREKVAEDIRKYLSSHNRDGEAYDFDIKLRKVNVPDEARDKWSSSQIDNIFNYEAGERLEFFMEELMRDFPWIHGTRQEGRSGGWLTIVPDAAALDEYGNIEDLRFAKKRLKDLDEIDERVKEAKTAFKKDMESKVWWEER